jgi:kynurenine formamidase
MPKYIDLTLTYHAGMPGVSFDTARTLEKDGWNAKTLHLYSHAGTHMDAPLHFGVNGPTIDQILPESCIGPAWVVNLNGIAPKTQITVAHLGEVADKVQAGDSLLLKTGWSQHSQEKKYRDELPRISEALAYWCAEKKVKMLGVEPPSVADVNNLEEVTLIHKILLEAGVIIVEGLTNLEQLTQEKVTFMALPLKITGGDGAPARAIAIED